MACYGSNEHSECKPLQPLSQLPASRIGVFASPTLLSHPISCVHDIRGRYSLALEAKNTGLSQLGVFSPAASNQMSHIITASLVASVIFLSFSILLKHSAATASRWRKNLNSSRVSTPVTVGEDYSPRNLSRRAKISKLPLFRYFS